MYLITLFLLSSGRLSLAKLFNRARSGAEKGGGGGFESEVQ